MDLPSVFIKRLSHAIEESLPIPMWGNLPQFPWQTLSNLLQSSFELPSLEISAESADWKEASELLAGLGSDPIITSAVMAPLAPAVFCAIPSSDVHLLSKHLLDKEGKRSFSDIDFQKGFFRFFILQFLRLFDHLKVYPGLSPKLSSDSLPQSTSYCLDITCKVEGEQLLGRIICPAEFHNVFTSHMASRPFSLADVDSSMELTLSLQIGHVDISSAEWESISPGDFVILDLCSYNPSTQQGTFSLTLGTTPLLIAKRKHQEIKILDYATYEPLGGSMVDDNEDNYDEDFDEEEMFEDEEEEVEEEQEKGDIPEELFDAKDVSLSLRVEVAQITMPLKELLLLKPGNTLQLPVSVQQGVTITLNSKPIARGELLQIGDLLGVKISAITH